MRTTYFIGAVLSLFIVNNAIGQQAIYDVTAGNGYGLRFWSADAYKIHMGNGTEYNYGPVTSYSVKMNMNNEVGRGWTWGNSGAVPVAALNNLGNMQIAGSFTSAKLHTLGTGSLVNAGNIAPESGDLIIQSFTGGRSTTSGAQLEFVIPANSDGTNMWGQGRIITVAGNTSSGQATGKMILGTRRYWQKPGTSAPEWFYGDDVTIDGVGNVGLGTTTPQWKLDVSGLIAVNSQAVVSVLANEIYLGDVAGGDGYRDKLFLCTRDQKRVTLDENGNVGIGTTSPNQKLTVNGTIYSKEVKVDLSVPGPDYVFEENYNLSSLFEIETFIKQNKHLPEVPSAKEMETNGVNLSEMNMVLLKKIEELTLHLIEQSKKLDEQIVTNQLQAKQIESLLKTYK